MTATASEDEKSDFPNVVIILVDDLGFSDFGCYGSEIQTPNIDSLASNGIRFTHAYNTSKCFPSRAALLAGVYPQQCGMGETHTNPIRNVVTLGDVFKSAGYKTYWSGKHHGVDNPTDLGFDEYYGLRDGACNHFNPGNRRDGEPEPAKKPNRPPRVWRMDGQTYAPYTPENTNFYTTDAFTDKALQWLRNHDGGPFFLYLAYTAPHDPLMAWPEDIEKYEGVYDKGYEAIRIARFKKQKELGLLDFRYHLSEGVYRQWDELVENDRLSDTRRMEVYAAMIDRVDQNVGRLLDQLELMGCMDNTLIIAASDNGASREVVKVNESGTIGSIDRWASLGQDWANVSNTPLRFFKNDSFEGGIRTPFIVQWPNGIKHPGKIREDPIHFIDIMATVAELTGVSIPKHFDGEAIVPSQGISFCDILNGQKREKGRLLFWEWKDGRAVRKDDWKLVTRGTEWELYNLKRDPSETVNLRAHHPKITQELIAQHDQWRIRVNSVGAK